MRPRIASDVYQVAVQLGEGRRFTPRDIHPKLPQYSHEQVSGALQTLRTAGAVRSLEYATWVVSGPYTAAPRQARGPATPATPATLEPPPPALHPSVLAAASAADRIQCVRLRAVLSVGACTSRFDRARRPDSAQHLYECKGCPDGASLLERFQAPAPVAVLPRQVRQRRRRKLPVVQPKGGGAHFEQALDAPTAPAKGT